jgi:hypothetical protein
MLKGLGGLGYPISPLLRSIVSEAAGVEREAETHAALDMAEIAKRDGLVTRQQVADYLGVSYKKVQRWDPKNGKNAILKRCPGLPGVVRYRARDVLRLASAPGKER